MKSISTLAEQLGITPAIVRSWQINLNLNLPKFSNEDPVYNEEWVLFFEKVAHLRKQGFSFSKIRAVLANEQPSLERLPTPGSYEVVQSTKTAQSFIPPQITPPEVKPNGNGSNNISEAVLVPQQNTQALQTLQTSMSEALVQQDMNKITHTYVQLVENYQALASRYSESTFVLGQLEEKNRAMEEKLRLLEEEKKAQVTNMEAHIDTLKDMLKSQESRLENADSHQASKEQLEQVEKQIKLLAVTMFKQQEQAKAEKPSGFWQRFKTGLFGNG